MAFSNQNPFGQKIRTFLELSPALHDFRNFVVASAVKSASGFDPFDQPKTVWNHPILEKIVDFVMDDTVEKSQVGKAPSLVSMLAPTPYEAPLIHIRNLGAGPAPTMSKGYDLHPWDPFVFQKHDPHPFESVLSRYSLQHLVGEERERMLTHPGMHIYPNELEPGEQELPEGFVVKHPVCTILWVFPEREHSLVKNDNCVSHTLCMHLSRVGLRAAPGAGPQSNFEDASTVQRHKVNGERCVLYSTLGQDVVFINHEKPGLCQLFEGLNVSFLFHLERMGIGDYVLLKGHYAGVPLVENDELIRFFLRKIKFSGINLRVATAQDPCDGTVISNFPYVNSLYFKTPGNETVDLAGDAFTRGGLVDQVCEYFGKRQRAQTVSPRVNEYRIRLSEDFLVFDFVRTRFGKRMSDSLEKCCAMVHQLLANRSPSALHMEESSPSIF